MFIVSTFEFTIIDNVIWNVMSVSEQEFSSKKEVQTCYWDIYTTILK